LAAQLTSPLTRPSGSGYGTRGALRFLYLLFCLSLLYHLAALLQVNPQLYSAFRMPGSVEYEDKDKKPQPVKYGPKADEGESSLKEGQKCPGFPFNPHRECVPHAALISATPLLWTACW
jgi:hypothetical protein